MTFAGINYLAVVLAAVAAWLLGAAWYGVLAKPWVAAQGKSMEEFKAQQQEALPSPMRRSSSPSWPSWSWPGCSPACSAISAPAR
jgi:hypothetical protein